MAITLWRPWDILVTTGLKPVENRPWAPDARLKIGDWLAIHAGLKWDEKAVLMADKLGIGQQPVRTYPASRIGAVVGVGRYLGWFNAASTSPCSVTVEERHRLWFMGPIGWVLGDLRNLSEPIRCRGRQKLWRLSPSVESMLRVRARLPAT